MKNKVDKYGRAATIKIKINGKCVNNCVYCLFNQTNELLQVDDIAYFLGIIKETNYYRIVINGGEPTIHPNYLSIIEFLKTLTENVKLEIGTNMIPFTFKKYKTERYFEKTLDVFSRFQIGCDDEHNNIDIVEHFMPKLIEQNKKVALNAINGFYSDKTKYRLEKLKEKYGITLYFSDLAHDYKQNRLLNKLDFLCKFKESEFLLNSNGDGYFCYQQEFESPLFNLFKDLDYKIEDIINNKTIDKPYKFCEHCSKYKPE